MIINMHNFINLLKNNENDNSIENEYLDLKYFLTKTMNENEQYNFYFLYLPFIIELSSINILDKNFHLKSQENKEIKISRLEVASIIASSFLNKIKNSTLDDNAYSYKNFINIFNKPKPLKLNIDIDNYDEYLLNIAKQSLEINDPDEISMLHIEKLKFIMGYFKSIFKIYKNNIDFLKNDFITFKRIVKDININIFDKKELSDIEIVKSNIEHLNNTAKVIFANKYIGGKILSEGCCQEEIKFLTNPELLVGLIISDKLENNEVLIIDGTITYSTYKNYGFDLLFNKSIESINSNSEKEYIIEIDAYKYNIKNKQLQYNKFNKDRDIKKAILGFSDTNYDIISTGNWGCGAFLGNEVLKFLIQWYAASVCNKKINYCIHNINLIAKLNKIKQVIKLFNTSELLEYIYDFK